MIVDNVPGFGFEKSIGSIEEIDTFASIKQSGLLNEKMSLN